MACPFGFHSSRADSNDLIAADNTSPRRQPADKVKSSACPFAGGADDERFNYNKDPISWFYQNQIKSEEEFQANKEQLRQEARTRLDKIFEKKGKHLIVDSDDDGFSIASSEISAWDSDVHSICTLASAANSWAAQASFKAPARVTLRVVLGITLLMSGYSAWHSLQAMLSINRFWGIITFGWIPAASLFAAIMVAAAAGTFMYLTDDRSKPWLLAVQIVVHVLCAGCTLLAMLCWVYPSHVDLKMMNASVCKNPGLKEASARLCQYLPMVQEQVSLAIATIMAANAYLAVLALAASCAGTWHFWELAFVEKKASKHKRRRRHTKNTIPWDKIKVEDIGPISFCGGAPPKGAMSAASVQDNIFEGKKKV